MSPTERVESQGLPRELDFCGTTISPTRAGESPFVWRVFDDLFDEQMIVAARKAFPPDSWPEWLHYSSPGERKFTANKNIPAPCRDLLTALNELCPPWLVNDPELYAGGMHAIPSGGWLDVHLDCDRHPITRNRRAVNAVLFIDEWEPSWGGELEFWKGNSSQVESCEVRVLPAAGRLILFETNDCSYHGISKPIQCPPEICRRTLAVYWWEPIDGPCRRPRAKFVATPGESPDPEKDRWREERCRRS